MRVSFVAGLMMLGSVLIGCDQNSQGINSNKQKSIHKAAMKNASTAALKDRRGKALQEAEAIISNKKLSAKEKYDKLDPIIGHVFNYEPTSDEDKARYKNCIDNYETITKNNNISNRLNSMSKKAVNLCNRHPTWSDDDCETISKGQISIGMTKEKVRAAWGSPYTVNRTTNAYGSTEQWVMHEIGNTYVYFEDGICTTIQN